MLPKQRAHLYYSYGLFLCAAASLLFLPRGAVFFNDFYLPPQTKAWRFMLVAFFVVFFILYYRFLRSLRDCEEVDLIAKRFLKFFWVSFSIVLVVLCFSQSLLSRDLYEYCFRARMLALYHLNPYLHIPAEIKQDMFFEHLFWKKTPECYGPAWVLIGSLHTYFFQKSFYLTLFLHKFVLFLFYCGSGYYFYAIAKEIRLKNSLFLTIFFITNPLMIVMSVVDGHNEIMMVFCFLAALYSLIRGKYIPFSIFLALAVNSKFVYISCLPFLFVYFWFDARIKNLRQRVLVLFQSLIVFVFISVAVWAPFGLKSMQAIYSYYKDLGGLFWPDSIAYFVLFLLTSVGLAVSQEGVAVFFTLLFFVCYVFMLWRYWKDAQSNKGDLVSVIALLLIILLLLNYSPFQTWYIVWFFPFLLLSRFKLKNSFAFIISFFLLLTFWKRMSVLLIPTSILCVLILLFQKRFAKQKLLLDTL